MSEARDRTPNLMVPSQIRFRCTVMGTPWIPIKMYWYKHRFRLHCTFLVFSPGFSSFTTHAVGFCFCFCFLLKFVPVVPLLKTPIWFLIPWKMKYSFMHGRLLTSPLALAQLSLRRLKGPLPPWRFSHFICVPPPSIEMPFSCPQLQRLSPYGKGLFTRMTLWNYLKVRISALMYHSSFKYQRLTQSRSKYACLKIVCCPQNPP